MRRIIFLASIICLFLSSACYKETTTSAAANPWDKVELSAIGPIRNMHSGPNEVLAINDLEFFRIDAENKVIEERAIGLAGFYFGRPAIGDWVFARFIGKQNINVVEFHLVRNSESTRDLVVNDIELPNGASIDFEGTSAKDAGAFNEDASQLAFPVQINTPGQPSNMGIVIVDINLNSTKQEFVSVQVKHVVSIPEMSANPQTMSNITYINGAYYVTHQDGGFRITPNGTYDQVVSGWTLDVFAKENKLYMTSFNSFDFYVSEDNGSSFQRAGITSPARFVYQADNQYFHQANRGFEYKLISDDFEELRDIVYNRAILDQNDNAAFRNIIYMGGRYYVNVQQDIYYLEEITLKE